MLHLTKEAPEVASGFGRYMLALMRATNREITEFSDSCLIAAQVAMQGARDNPLDMMQALEVLQHNQALMTKGVLSAQEKMMDYVFDQVEEGMQATFNTLFNVEGEKISGYINREAGVMESVANFNEQINKIKDEFGFHFNSGNYKLVHETDTFQMYQVLPLKAGVKVRDDVKPMLLVPPYMLGVHILSFLPYENKSYAHSFANEGVPTYVRVVKDIMTDAKVQQTTPDLTACKRSSSARS